MYTLSQLKKAWNCPPLVARELNRLYFTKLARREFNTEGVDIFEEDWDNLAILDACRYDLFKERHTLPGTLEARYSRGSHTKEFLRGNVQGRELLDTVYITASPMFYRDKEEYNTRFHAEINVWDTDWNKEHNTVLPEKVTKHAIEARKRFPQKRLLIHYIQPHYPFISNEDNREIQDVNKNNNIATLVGESQNGRDIWSELLENKLKKTKKEIWKEYKANFDVTMEPLQQLIEGMEGKTVISADHGNMIGEHSYPIPIKEWGHPPGIYTRELVKIPWLVNEGRKRPEIKEGERVHEEDLEHDKIIDDRLESLGYIE
jgi:hypothetical protein